MATPVILPKFSMTMEEGTILRWLKQEGESVRQGEPLAEVMTEKVNMEVEAPASGVLLEIRARVGDAIPVTQIIAYIGAKGEAPPAAPAGDAVPPSSVAEAAPAPSSPARAARSPAPPPAAREGPASAGSIAATPVARRVAREAGLDLAAIPGTGPGGRITEADVRAAHPLATRPGAVPRPAGPHSEPPAGSATSGRAPLNPRRRTIARRMEQSAREIPQICLTRAVEMSAAAAARGEASYTAVIVWAAARALRAHPMLRASFDADAVVVHDAIHVGVAVDTAEGLIVPIVRNADRKDLAALGVEVAALARRAREDTLGLDDVSGAVFTVSNLGMSGVDAFTALVNPPQTAILAVGAVRPRPWVIAGDALAVRPACHLTLALDHRVGDGAEGARFLDDLCRRLETMSE